MRRALLAALLAGAALAHAQAPAPAGKKELVARLLQLQKPGIESLARNLAERPAAQMMQSAAVVLQQLPPERREAAARAIEAEAKKYVEDVAPALRERTSNLAPAVVGPMLEEKFTEDELRQLVAWFEAPLSRKYQQIAPEMQNALAQKVAAETRTTIDPKLQALEQRMRAALAGTAAPASAAASAPAAAAPGAGPRPPARAASK